MATPKRPPPPRVHPGPSSAGDDDPTLTERKPIVVLVADDEKPERQRLAAVARSVLQELGREIQLIEATDGDELLAQVEDRHPSLVLSEVLLEGLSGWAVLRRLRKRYGEKGLPPIVMVTSLGRESDRYWGLRNGAHAYIIKPYDDDQLADKIRHVLKGGSRDL